MRVWMMVAAFVLVAFAGAPASAQSGYEHDWQTSNSYSWSRDFSGNTQLRGWNNRTGSQWSTTIQPDGDMRGLDSGGNYWAHDAETGFYQNFGTGRTCFGKGALRTCY